MEACRFEPFGYHQIVRERAGCFNVAPGGIEVRIGGDPLVCTAQNREEYGFGRASLMGWNDVIKRPEITNGGLESSKRRGPRVTFVAEHQCRPLCRAHGRSTTVRQQIDEDIVGT